MEWPFWATVIMHCMYVPTTYYSSTNLLSLCPIATNIIPLCHYKHSQCMSS
jgi:hypothetical protein